MKPRKTLQELQYDGDPPRCSSCTRRHFKRITRADGKKLRQMICKLAQQPVHGRGVCDAWRGSNGDVLDTQGR